MNVCRPAFPCDCAPFRQADALKAKLNRKCDFLNDFDVWRDHQHLQAVYHEVLVLDLEYALDKKVEQELWTLGFKNIISKIQALAKDKKVCVQDVQNVLVFAQFTHCMTPTYK